MNGEQAVIMGIVGIKKADHGTTEMAELNRRVQEKT